MMTQPSPATIMLIGFLATASQAFSSPYYAPWTCGVKRYCTQGNSQGDHVGTTGWSAFDFGLPLGEKILAARAGTVHSIKIDGSGGCCSSACNPKMNYVIINHGDGTYAHYYHLDTWSSSLQAGQAVSRGQVIGRAGFTGFSCGNNSSYIGDGSIADASASHLHYIIRDAARTALASSFADIGTPVTWGLYTSGNCAAPTNPCGNVTYQGICSGTTLTWCEGGALKSVNCSSTGKVCGWQDNTVGNNCLAPPPDPCQTLGYTGSCTGTVLKWCEAGTIKTVDCANQGKVCGWQDSTVGNNCLAPPPDPCQTLGYAGTCTGTTLQWCETGAIKTLDCATLGKTCGWQDATVGNNCLAPPATSPPPPTDPCTTFPTTGNCTGNVLKTCANATIRSTDCAASGKVCGSKDGSANVGCIDAPPQPASGCGSITESGVCEGSVLKWCEANGVRSRNCADSGNSCGFDGAVERSACLPTRSALPPIDPVLAPPSEPGQAFDAETFGAPASPPGPEKILEAPETSPVGGGCSAVGGEDALSFAAWVAFVLGRRLLRQRRERAHP